MSLVLTGFSVAELERYVLCAPPDMAAAAQRELDARKEDVEARIAAEKELAEIDEEIEFAEDELRDAERAVEVAETDLGDLLRKRAEIERRLMPEAA